jgi:hypothetical protein
MGKKEEIRTDFDAEIKSDPLESAQDAINWLKYYDGDNHRIEKLSDGYHSYKELYHHRAILFCALCAAYPGKAWKSLLHESGKMYAGMFIVGIDTPEGQYTYHCDIDPYWAMFRCKELARAPEYDGHEPGDIERLLSL